jgi:chemotaxis protein CheD
LKNDIYHDRINKVNEIGEIVLPIGHYALINGAYTSNNESPIISIYGLGSCIALILIDKNRKLCGMSHILLPDSGERKNIEYPHKYADLSVKKLHEELIEKGAEKKHIYAYIIGGSKIFDADINITGKENINSVKKELDKLNIKIINESVGGRRGRNIKFNTQDFTILVRSSGETKFQEL